MNQDTPNTIAEIEAELTANLISEENTTDALRWRRGLLYQKMRIIEPNKRIFGQWMEKTRKVSRLTDSPTVVTKLIRCIKLLDEDSFMLLGYSRSLEFAVNWLWKSTATFDVKEMIERAVNEEWTVQKCHLVITDLKPKTEGSSESESTQVSSSEDDTI